MVQWREVCPAEWQARVVEGALDVLPDAPGLVAAWLGGSLATGVADEYSDVDLNCLVEDTHMDAWREAWPSVVGRCAGPLVLANPIGGPVVGGYALTTAWEHVDLIVHARSTWSPPDPCRILHDPHALLTERLRPVAIGDPYYPDGLVTLFLYLAGNLVVTLGRGELVVAHAGVGGLRDLLVQLMLAEGGVVKADGQKRLNPYLSSEQQRVLESLPAPDVRGEEIMAASSRIIDEFVSRARQLADATGTTFPAELLEATQRHLRNHLGHAF